MHYKTGDEDKVHSLAHARLGREVELSCGRYPACPHCRDVATCRSRQQVANVVATCDIDIVKAPDTKFKALSKLITLSLTKILH